MTTIASPHPSSWKDTLGRLGLTGRGVLYAVIAFLALQLALGSPDGQASRQGAFAWIASQPLGKFLLVILTVALFALAVWRFLDAAYGDPVEGDDTTDRIRFAAKGAVYLVVAASAFSMTRASWGSGSGSSGGDGSSQQKATAIVLDWPLGTWLVGATGLAMIGYAIYMFKRHAIDAKFMERISTDSSAIPPLGRAGYGARAVVWATIGVLLIKAAVDYDPGQAGGLSTALQNLASTAFGPWLLGLVAVGLLAFGAFSVAEGRYRRAA